MYSISQSGRSILSLGVGEVRCTASSGVDYQAVHFSVWARHLSHPKENVSPTQTNALLICFREVRYLAHSEKWNAYPTVRNGIPSPRIEMECLVHSEKRNALPTPRNGMPSPLREMDCLAHSEKQNSQPTQRNRVPSPLRGTECLSHSEKRNTQPTQRNRTETCIKWGLDTRKKRNLAIKFHITCAIESVQGTLVRWSLHQQMIPVIPF